MFRLLTKSKIAFILAILFGISLFFFRSGSRYSNFFNSDSVIATVSGTPISTSKFNKTMQLNDHSLKICYILDPTFGCLKPKLKKLQAKNCFSQNISSLEKRENRHEGE